MNCDTVFGGSSSILVHLNPEIQGDVFRLQICDFLDLNLDETRAARRWTFLKKLGHKKRLQYVRIH